MRSTSLRLHHLAIQVPDLDVAEAFYGGVLGLAVTRRQGHAIWVDVDGVIIMLERCEVAAASAPPWRSAQPGLFVLALRMEPEDSEGWRSRLAAAGVGVDHESQFSLYFFDPFGTRLALSHYPEGGPGPGFGPD